MMAVDFSWFRVAYINHCIVLQKGPGRIRKQMIMAVHTLTVSFPIPLLPQVTMKTLPVRSGDWNIICTESGQAWEGKLREKMIG